MPKMFSWRPTLILSTACFKIVFAMSSAEQLMPLPVRRVAQSASVMKSRIFSAAMALCSACA